MKRAVHAVRAKRSIATPAPEKPAPPPSPPDAARELATLRAVVDAQRWDIAGLTEQRDARLTQSKPARPKCQR